MKCPYRVFLTLSILLAGADLHAASVGLVGLFPGKAVVVIDGSAPKTFSVGNQVADGIKLLSVTGTTATFDEHGKRQTLGIGNHVSHTEAGASGSASVTLQSDSRGHFIAPGKINDLSIAMLVDTGASMITLSSQDARRLGIDYKNGQQGFSATANGRVAVYQVRLNSVKVGDIELSQVDAVIQEQGLPFALLGMSFLNRTQMQRDGERMVLTKRY
jgi:aspartyl protease family protein